MIHAYFATCPRIFATVRHFMIYLDEAGNWDILERCGNDALKGKWCLNQNGMVK